MNAEDRSDARIRQGANILAAALAVFIVLPAVYSMPRAFCTVNGMLWAAWAQVLAIAGTGVAAVASILFAARAEKMRNSIRATEGVYGEMSLNEYKITPMDGTVLIAKTLRVNDKRHAYFSARDAMRAGAEPDSIPHYERVSAAVAAVNNYFGGLAILLEKHLVDRDFILNRFASIALRTYHDQFELDIRPPRAEFYRMAQASYAYLKGLGYEDVEPPEEPPSTQ
jgi:hypothetical protein